MSGDAHSCGDPDHSGGCLYGGGARLQVTEEQMQLVTEKRKQIYEKLGRLFSAVLLDLEERNPSD